MEEWKLVSFWTHEQRDLLKRYRSFKTKGRPALSVKDQAEGCVLLRLYRQETTRRSRSKLSRDASKYDEYKKREAKRKRDDRLRKKTAKETNNPGNRSSLAETLLNKGVLCSYSTARLEALFCGGSRGCFLGGTQGFGPFLTQRKYLSALATKYMFRADPKRWSRYFSMVSGERKKKLNNLRYSLSKSVGFGEAFSLGENKGTELAGGFAKGIKDELVRAKFMRKEEWLICQLSFMDTIGGTRRQKPHIDFPTWKEVTTGASRPVVPILLFFPITSSG